MIDRRAGVGHLDQNHGRHDLGIGDHHHDADGDGTNDITTTVSYGADTLVSRVTNIDDDTLAEAGKLKVGSTNPVAEVQEWDSSTRDLTVKLISRFQ